MGKETISTRGFKINATNTKFRLCSYNSDNAPFDLGEKKWTRNSKTARFSKCLSGGRDKGYFGWNSLLGATVSSIWDVTIFGIRH